MDSTVVVAMMGTLGTTIVGPFFAWWLTRRAAERKYAAQVGGLKTVREPEGQVVYKIRRDDLAHLEEIKEAICGAMRNLSFPNDCISAFRGSIHELVLNAFEHSHPQDSTFKISIDLQKASLTLVVAVPRRSRFSLDESLQQSRARAALDPATPRGRGLWYVSENADVFRQHSDALQAIFFKERVKLDVTRVTGEPIVIIAVKSGALNPSLRARFWRIVEKTEGRGYRARFRGRRDGGAAGFHARRHGGRRPN